jgi:uncharacterized membrane protein
VLTLCDSRRSGDPWLRITFVLASIFFIIFSYYSILRYLSLNATGFDLGIYSSALFNAIHGGLFYTNLLNESYLGNHFSPFIFFLVPFFYIYAHNATLLVLQAFFISFGAIPLYLSYRIVIPKIEHRIYGIFLVLVYEFSPISIGPISFDFHLMALMPFFYLFAIFFFLSRRMVPFYISIIAIVSIHAFFAIIVIFLITSIYISKYARRGWIREFINRKREGLAVIFSFFITVVALIGYLLFAEHMKSVINGSSMQITGVQSFLVYLKNEYNTSFSLKMLLFSSGSKFELLVLAILGGGFLAILSPLALFPVIPFFLFSAFSKNTAYYTAGYQYTAMFSPMIFSAAVFSLKKIFEGIRKIRFPKARIKMVIVVILVGVLAFNYAMSPISPDPVHIQSGNITSISEFHENNTSRALFLLRDNINSSSLILTQNNLYPQFSKFPDAYLLYSYSLTGNLTNLLERNFTFVIADSYSPFYNLSDLVGISMRELVHRLSSSDYGYYFNEYGIIVLKYHYSGPEYIMVHNRLVPV